MTLAVHVEVVRPDTWGWTWVRDELAADGEPSVFKWSLDPDAMVGTGPEGVRLRLSPFACSAWAPRATGGNMDCKELGAGSVLYLPVAVSGGLVSVGDGHARQGDGELAGTLRYEPR